MSGNNTVHWLVNPLEPEDITVLKRAQKGLLPFDHKYKRFEIAYLIARECLSFDGDSVKITAKGEDALIFYAEEKQTIAG